jgi:hypothetical protein
LVTSVLRRSAERGPNRGIEHGTDYKNIAFWSAPTGIAAKRATLPWHCTHSPNAIEWATAVELTFPDAFKTERID